MPWKNSHQLSFSPLVIDFTRADSLRIDRFRFSNNHYGEKMTSLRYARCSYIPAGSVTHGFPDAAVSHLSQKRMQPHSDLSCPAQRPARSVSPNCIGRVHGAQPMLKHLHGSSFTNLTVSENIQPRPKLRLVFVPPVIQRITQGLFQRNLWLPPGSLMDLCGATRQ